MLNSEEHSEKRVVGKPFSPGVSGNPAGRPRGALTKDLTALAKARTREMVRVLAEIALDPKAKPGDRITAANAVLDRGWGRPAQQVDLAVAVKTAIEGRSLDDLMTLRAQYAASLTAVPLLIEGEAEPIEETPSAEDETISTG